MASSRKKRVRFTIDVNFSSEAEKDAFSARLSEVRARLTPRGAHALNNYELMLELAGEQNINQPEAPPHPSTGTFLRNSGLCQVVHSLLAA